MTDSGKDRQEYSQRLKPLSAEEYARQRHGEQRPTYLSKPGVDRKQDRTTYTFSNELRDRAAGRRKWADWIWLLLALAVMVIQVARQDPAERFNFGFLLNPVSIAALLIVVLLAVVTQLLEKRGSAHPDPMAVFEQRAYFNLVERGLLRRTLEAGDTHELLPPRNESVLTRELISSKRSLDDEEARIRFLLANYPVICERHGYDWTVDRRRSGKYKWRDDSLLASENQDNPYNRRLCAIIDELLSSGRY